MIGRSYLVETDNLLVDEWHSIFNEKIESKKLSAFVISLLMPNVTQSLPPGWQGEYTAERAQEWIEDRDREGTLLLALERTSSAPIGLMVLSECEDPSGKQTVRLGYLLMESCWGRGYASELVQGCVEWCRTAGIAVIEAGVTRDNIPSQRVLSKNGFIKIRNRDDRAEEWFYELQL